MSSRKKIDDFILKHKFADAEMGDGKEYLSLEDVERLLLKQKKQLNTYANALKIISEKIKKDEDLKMAYLATLSLCYVDSANSRNPEINVSQKELLEIGEVAAERFLQLLTSV
jgi:hypothetical protein